MRRAIFCAYLGIITLFAACSSSPPQQGQSQTPQEPAVQQPAEKPLTAEAVPSPGGQAARAKPARAAVNRKTAVASHKTAPTVVPRQAESAPVYARTPAKSEPVYTPPAVAADSGQPPIGAARVTEPATVAPAAAVPPPPPPPPPAPVYATVREGSKIAIRLSDTIDSATAQADDTFHGTLDEDLVADGKTVAPRGSDIIGKVVTAGASGRVKGRANLSLILTEIRVGNASYPIRTNTLSFEAESTQKKDAAKIGGGAGLGAIIGAIAGGGKGAAIGAVVGGAAGTGGVLATRGKDVKFSREDRLAFSLREDFSIRLQ